MLRGANSSTKHMNKHWEWSNQTQPQWSRHARRARETGPGSRPLPEGIEVCCRAERCNAGSCCWPAPWPASPAAGTLCGSVSNLSSAEHWSRLSGRRPLSERPSTRISRCRAVPTAGSAGPGRWPARHVPTIARSRDFYFRKSAVWLFSYYSVVCSCVLALPIVCVLCLMGAAVAPPPLV